MSGRQFGIKYGKALAYQEKAKVKVNFLHKKMMA
jgi:hypothetical protein